MQLRWHFNWKLVVFVVLFFPVLLRLGFWQLDRADEKRNMQQAQASLATLPAIDVALLDEGQWQTYRPVRASGKLTDKVFLIDNQIYKGRFGYEVLQMMELDVDTSLLISRGWIKGSMDRQVLPNINTPDELVTVTGYLYKPMAAYSLGEAMVDDGWPKVVQSIDVENLFKLAAKNDRIARPFVIRLESGGEYSLTSHWQIINVRPEKHTAYAAQWFGMAVLLLGLFIYASLKRDTDTQETKKQ